MTEEQFRKAQELRRQKFNIERELDVWNGRLCDRKRLAWVMDDLREVSKGLDTQIPPSLFDSFRTAAINALKVRLAEIDAEFAAI